MSDPDNKPIEEDDEATSKYIPPKEVALNELLSLDAEDTALNKYKQQLVGNAVNVILEPTDERKVLMKRVVMIPEDHPELSFDLSGTNVDKLKDTVVLLREGSIYRVKIEFYVQRDIVSGLKYVQTAHKGPIRTDKTTYMLGSRAPKPEVQEYLSDKETVPSGMLARGKYSMKTTITDDDKHVYLKWEWTLEIGKDWK